MATLPATRPSRTEPPSGMEWECRWPPPGDVVVHLRGNRDRGHGERANLGDQRRLNHANRVLLLVTSRLSWQVLLQVQSVEK
jgi:hypothetical protein